MINNRNEEILLNSISRWVGCPFKPEWVEFIAEDYIIDQIVDWFGKDIRIAKHGDKQLKVAVKVSLMAMEHWAMQYAGHVTVTAPEGLKERIKNRLAEAAEKYKII